MIISRLRHVQAKIKRSSGQAKDFIVIILTNTGNYAFSRRFAIQNSFGYQKADRLVYCNIPERLIVHIKTAEKTESEGADNGEVQETAAP